MDRHNTKVRVFFIKLLKVLLIPVSRCRKCIRQCSTRHTNISIGVGAVLLSVITVIYLYRLSLILMEKRNEHTTPEYPDGTPMIHVPLNEIYKDFIKDDEAGKDDVQREPVGMVNTPGCKIPIVMIDYEKYVSNRTNNRPMCGKRAVYLRKYDNDKVIARIKAQIINKYAKIYKNIQCCYRFVIDTLKYPYERPRVIFSNCTHFKDEAIITLESDFVNIICTGYVTAINKSRIIYDDMFAFSKKINTTKPKPTSCKRHIRYNVLMLGMDSMSLPRAVKTLPRTIDFFKSDNWLGFRGFHKIADNNLPNLMAVLTGKNMSTIIKDCFRRMDECNEMIIWNDFKKAGYVTAYGEDYLELPDMFSKEYEFYDPPTDHYMRPFFIKRETKNKNSILCAGKSPSGKQVLDYALDFANTYRKDSFFGLFWINSFSHDVASHPEDADKIIENFLNQLTYTGILANTFVMFFSGHGLRFGNLRSKMESYYDDRMPMNFLWIPLLFKGKQPYEVRALAINQFRLATPYDIYNTLLDIKKISLCSNVTERAPEGCPNCHSMFEVISNNRTCQSVAIHDKWCSCHKMYPLPEQDPVGIKSVYAVVNYIKSKVMTIETQHCWSCKPLSLKNITRIHFYYDNNDKVSLFYVVAFSMTPGDISYEATVLRKGADENGYNITGPISLISQYKGFGRCALNRRDRIFCVCQKKDNCY